MLILSIHHFCTNENTFSPPKFQMHLPTSRKPSSSFSHLPFIVFPSCLAWFPFVSSYFFHHFPSLSASFPPVFAENPPRHGPGGGAPRLRRARLRPLGVLRGIHRGGRARCGRMTAWGVSRRKMGDFSVKHVKKWGI